MLFVKAVLKMKQLFDYKYTFFFNLKTSPAAIISIVIDM
jgi:hypothetical protein